MGAEILCAKNLKYRIIYWLDRILMRDCWTIDGEKKPTSYGIACVWARERDIIYKHVPFFQKAPNERRT